MGRLSSLILVLLLTSNKLWQWKTLLLELPFGWHPKLFSNILRHSLFISCTFLQTIEVPHLFIPISSFSSRSISGLWELRLLSLRNVSHQKLISIQCKFFSLSQMILLQSLREISLLNLRYFDLIHSETKNLSENNLVARILLQHALKRIPEKGHPHLSF